MDIDEETQLQLCQTKKLFAEMLNDYDEFQDTIRCYRELLQINPNHVTGLIEMALCLKVCAKMHEQRDEFSAAEEMYYEAFSSLEKAVELDSNSKEALENLAYTWLDFGSIQGKPSTLEPALNLLLQLTQSYPKDAKAKFYLASTTFELGLMNRDIELLQSAMAFLKTAESLSTEYHEQIFLLRGRCSIAIDML